MLKGFCRLKSAVKSRIVYKQEGRLNTSEQKIIVLSRNYSTGLGVIRSLGSAGYSVDLIASTKKKGSSVIASSSRYVKHAEEVQSPKIQGDDGETIIQTLLKKNLQSSSKTILFPTDDFTANVIAKNAERLSEKYLMPFVNKDRDFTISEVMDKSFQSRLAEKCGLKVPEEWVISLSTEIKLPENIIFPCFVKPLQSVSGRKDEMKICQNKKELITHLNKMQLFYSDRSVLIQKYLYTVCEYDLSGVCIDQRVIIPAVIKKDVVAQFEKGVTMTGVMYPCDILKSIRESVVTFLKELHYTGMFDMEFIQCEDGIYFNEINLRSGGPSYFYFMNGVNLPDVFVRAVTEQDVDIDLTCNTGTTFIYEKVAWEDYIHGYISRSEMKNYIKNADFTLISDKTDPKPGKIFNHKIRLSFLKNRLLDKLGR